MTLQFHIPIVILVGRQRLGTHCTWTWRGVPLNITYERHYLLNEILTNILLFIELPQVYISEAYVKQNFRIMIC